MPEEVSVDAIVKYVEEESGVAWANVPLSDQVCWLPVGHPNSASPFRDQFGLPIPLRAGEVWPLSNGGQRMLIMFEDSDEIRIYCLPARQPIEGEDLPPRRYRLSKHGFVFSAQRMSFSTWRDQLVVEVLLAVGDDDDDGIGEDDEDEPEAGPASGVSAAGAPAAPTS